MRRNVFFIRFIRLFCTLGIFTLLFLFAIALVGLTFAAPRPVEGAALPGQPAAPQTGHWEVVNSPNVGTGDNSLTSVTGNASNDVTAVGSYFDSSSHELTLIEHWDGSVWSVVPSQSPDPNLNRLSSVARDMSGGYWAAGTSFNASYGSLIERQTTPGDPWSLVSVPSISGYPSLASISADSPTDAWAVGNHNGGSPNFYQQTLVMHWSGTAWSVVTSPNPGTANNYLTGVVAVDANNMWAVGYTNTPPSSNFSPITIHCDSSLTCTAVSFPMAGTSAQLRSITGRVNGSSVQLWAGGYYSDTGVHALVGYGDGSSWSLNSPTSLVGVINGIYAVDHSN